MSVLLDWPGHRWTALGARVYLAGVFLFAWYPKVVDPSLFALQVSAYEILPLWLVRVVASTLPWLELVVALLLVAGIATRHAAGVAAGLLILFMVAGAVALARGIELSCGCFGSDDPVGAWSLGRNAGWVLLAVYVVVVDRRPLGLASIHSR